MKQSKVKTAIGVIVAVALAILIYRGAYSKGFNEGARYDEYKVGIALTAVMNDNSKIAALAKQNTDSPLSAQLLDLTNDISDKTTSLIKLLTMR